MKKQKAKTLVVTSWNDRLYKEYAHLFEQTYNWEMDYIVYNEDQGMFEEIPECKAFVERHKNRGKKKWYLNAVRFCYKVYAYCHALRTYAEDYDGIIFIDADSYFYKPIDEAWIEKHIRREHMMITYLGRGKYHSECGFMYFNLKHPSIQNFADKLQSMYDEDKLFELREHHDSYVFDTVRETYQNKGVENYDIGDEYWGHVQERSILGGIYDHMKGGRKYEGGSFENPLSKTYSEERVKLSQQDWSEWRIKNNPKRRRV